MKYIKRLIIKKFNETEKTLDIEFDTGINVLIGMHGCGKTLMIKTITALLNENLASLRSYPIGDAELTFEDGETIAYNVYRDSIEKSFYNFENPNFECGTVDTKEKFLDFFHCKSKKVEATEKQINKIISPDFEVKIDETEPKNKNRFIEIEYYKDGKKQLPYFDVKDTYVGAYEKIGNFIMRSQMNDFLLLDEPEQGLCIEWQKELLPALNENVNQIICTTHSPFIFKLEDSWNVSELGKYLTKGGKKSPSSVSGRWIAFLLDRHDKTCYTKHIRAGTARRAW